MIGKRVWLAPDCFWPEITTPGHYVSHEAICVLNTGDTDAEIDVAASGTHLPVAEKKSQIGGVLKVEVRVVAAAGEPLGDKAAERLVRDSEKFKV